MLSALFLVVTVSIALRYRGAQAWEPSDRLTVRAAFVFFGIAALTDVAIGVQWIEGPFLMGISYAWLTVAFTAVLTRRFVRSVARVEESAERLQQAAEERTRALREKDLQLAHGGALATVGTLAAGLAHEINNPIAFISANLNHLHELCGEEGGEEEFEEVLEETREGVARIRGIVDELLRLGRRGGGRMEPVDVAGVAGSVLPIVRHEARGRARIDTAIRRTPPVLGDRGLLGQVILNLVLNAIHAIPEEGREGHVRISTDCDATHVRLQVQDDGCGIPEDVLPHIFEPFYTTKGSGKGTGLGLAITRQQVTRHGGHIDVESGPRGTVMRVTLPRADAAEPAEADVFGEAAASA